MSHISHVLLAGSLLLSQIDQNVSAQTIPAGSPGDKATIASLSTQSRVQDVIAPKSFVPSQEIIVKDTTSLSWNDKAYAAAVEQVQTRTYRVFSLDINDSGSRMGFGNNMAGSPALVVTNELRFDDRRAKGSWEAWMGEKNSAFIKMKMVF